MLCHVVDVFHLFHVLRVLPTSSPCSPIQDGGMEQFVEPWMNVKFVTLSTLRSVVPLEMFLHRTLYPHIL